MTATTKSLSLPVQGMTCASCVSHVEGALKELPGVSNVVVNLGTNKASLMYDPARATLADMARAVDDVGYAVPTAELTLGVRGMTCASCVSNVEGALKEQVRHVIGSFAAPDVIHVASGLPKTRSGKIMRRILRKIACSEYDGLGDITTLAEPEVVDRLIQEHKTRAR